MTHGEDAGIILPSISYHLIHRNRYEVLRVQLLHDGLQIPVDSPAKQHVVRLREISYQPPHPPRLPAGFQTILVHRGIRRGANRDYLPEFVSFSATFRVM